MHGTIERALEIGVIGRIYCGDARELAEKLAETTERLRGSWPTAIISPRRLETPKYPFPFCVDVARETGEPTISREFHPDIGDVVIVRDNGAERIFIDDYSGGENAERAYRNAERAYHYREHEARDAEPVTCPDCLHRFNCIMHFGRCPQCGCTG